LVALLRAARLKPLEGRYSVRVEECEHFIFQRYGGDMEPIIDADAETVARMVADAALVSRALALANVRHRLEVYGSDDRLAGYFHQDWPREV
jgi:hypothetical protein